MAVLQFARRIQPAPAAFIIMNSLTTQLYSSLLRHAALLLAGHTSAAAMQPADLLHMAVERLCSRPPALIEQHAGRFTGLMRTIMQRTLIDELRRFRTARRPDLCSAAMLEEAEEVPGDNTGAAYATVHEALNVLGSADPAAAALLRMRYLEGRTGVELAARFHVSTPVISRRLAAALAALRKIMETEISG
jgi:RNA polymerase sigma factor (sigma-70 family)